MKNKKKTKGIIESMYILLMMSFIIGSVFSFERVAEVKLVIY